MSANRANASAFLRLAFLGEPKRAVELYCGHDYIQHNPAVPDGKQGFIAYFTTMATKYPSKTIDIIRSLGEGDLVALHTHQIWPEDGDEYVTMDFFRFDHAGKIVEHWDAVQKVPCQFAHNNSMY